MESNTDLPNIRAHLANFGQEQYASHPFFGAQPGFSGKVMHMADKPFENKGKARILCLGIYQDSVLGDIVNGHVHERRNIDLGGIHDGFIANHKTAGP